MVRLSPDGQTAAALRAIAATALLLAAGGFLYAGFVKDVFARGDKIVDVSLKSKEARPMLQLGGSALLCFAASGLVSFVPALRGRRLSPLLGLGLALVPGALVGLTAFSLGRTALRLALVVAAPSLLTMAVACAVPPRPRPGLGRFLARSWMATGFLVGLVLLALAGLDLAETARPRVPWASVMAALAIGTVLQMAARYVALHGARPTAFAVDHQQKREAHETDAVRAVADRLHPYVEEGRGQEAYAALAHDLGAVGRLQPPPPPELPAGPPVLPGPHAAVAAALRAAAFAVPVAVLVPLVGWPTAAATFGLLLPLARKSLNPAKDPTPRAWWLAGAAAAAAGGAWLGSRFSAYAWGLARLTWPAAAVLGAPYAVVFLGTLAQRPLPGHIGHLRLEQARRLGARWLRSAGRGLAVAAVSLGSPAILWAVALSTGLRVPAVPWRLLVAVAAAGVLWALAAVVCGPAASRHRAQLDAQHQAQVQARASAHRMFLDRLEMT